MTVYSAPKLPVLLLLIVWTCSPTAAGSALTPGTQAAGTGSGAFPDETERPFDRSITTPELFEKAREAFGLEKHGLAETFYQEILIREPSNVQAMLELANVYERSGKLEYARGLLNRSAKLQPGNKTIQQKLETVERLLNIALTDQVDSLMAGNKFELAIPKLSLQISIDPINSELLYRKAVCYMKIDRPEAALADLDNALRINYQDKYNELRGAVFKALKQKETRELIALAKRLISAGSPADRQEAVGVLGEVLQVDPDNEWAKTEFLRLSAAAETDSSGQPESDGAGAGIGALWGSLTDAGKKIVSSSSRYVGAVLLFFALLLLFRSPLTRLLIRTFFPRPALSGTFRKFDLSEILFLLNAEYHTGVVTVKGESCRGKIYFEKGEPCHCFVGKITGVDALVHLLRNTASGYFSFADGSMPLNRTINTPLSIILMDHTSARAGSTRPRGDKGADQAPAKPKSRMKELLDSKTSD